jgi:hypothetical protein
VIATFLHAPKDSAIGFAILATGLAAYGLWRYVTSTTQTSTPRGGV